MKILYIISTLASADGVTAFLMNYLMNMNLSGLSITIACSTSKANTKYLDFCEKHNIEIINVSHPTEVGLKQFIKNVQHFANKHHDYDIVHCNTVTTSYFFLKELKKYNIPIRIMHSHSTKNGETILKNIRNTIMAKIAIRLCNTYFACSDLAGKYLFKKRHFYLIYNAMNVEKFYPFSDKDKEELKIQLNIQNDLVIGFVGRIVNQKNPFFLIEIAKSLVEKTNINFKFLIVGKGSLEKELKQKIIENKLSNYFIFTGEVSDTSKYYSVMDCFVLPSRYEGLGIVAIEAQLSHIPCLLSDKVPIEVIISNKVVLLPINNSNLWAENILQSINDSNDFVVDANKYDIRISPLNLLNIYNDLKKAKNN